jgi:hypothetical protein
VQVEKTVSGVDWVLVNRDAQMAEKLRMVDWTAQQTVLVKPQWDKDNDSWQVADNEVILARQRGRRRDDLVGEPHHFIREGWELLDKYCCFN